ncbi:MAG: IS66 family insertion sequence element accessory protein TnpB [Phycisphaerales bacterium]|nr:MAG: IS66 family insertion sequence element accessory protein TnpB [Phycisphaerales bacterium]
MLTLPPSVRIFVCLAPADMRRSLDGLAAMTRDTLREDPLSGHLYVFFNRRRDRTKILFWDRSGLCLYYKRLERGVFRLSSLEDSNSRGAEIEAAELSLILEGIDLSRARRRARFIPGKSA